MTAFASGMYPSDHRFHLAPPGEDIPVWHTSCPHTRDELIAKGWRLIFLDEDFEEWDCSHDGPIFSSTPFAST